MFLIVYGCLLLVTAGVPPVLIAQQNSIEFSSNNFAFNCGALSEIHWKLITWFFERCKSIQVIELLPPAQLHSDDFSCTVIKELGISIKHIFLIKMIDSYKACNI